jgi:hypothetical protein
MMIGSIPNGFLASLHSIFKSRARPIKIISGGICEEVNESDRYPSWFELNWKNV